MWGNYLLSFLLVYDETQQSWDKNAVDSVTFRFDIKTIIVTLWPMYKAIYVISFEFIISMQKYSQLLNLSEVIKSHNFLVQFTSGFSTCILT